MAATHHDQADGSAPANHGDIDVPAVVDLIVDALDHHPAVDHGADVPAGEVVG